MPAVLFYGTDAGLVCERAAKLAAIVAARDNPPGEIIRMDDADLDNDPDRLAVELQTIPMFGGSKVVRATAGRRITAAALQPLHRRRQARRHADRRRRKPAPDGYPAHAVREVPQGGGRRLLRRRGARPRDAHTRDPEGATGSPSRPKRAISSLTRIGADRALSRGEIDKLALYAAGKSEIDVSDVEAIVGDASELAIDRILDGAASGDAARAVAEFARAVAAGESAQTIILAAQRHLAAAAPHPLRHRPGRSFEDAVRQLRPPIHFKQKDAIGLQCRLWTTPRLSEALARASAAAKAARLSAPLEEPSPRSC